MNKKVLATVAFVMVVGGVLITFTFLGSQGGPPPMAGGPQHRLRFDLNRDMIGVETDPPVDVLNLPPITDKKAIEKRVNTGCTQCHATLPEHHPPKTECIKCHRMAPANAPTPAAAPESPASAYADGGPAAAQRGGGVALPGSTDAGSANAVQDAGLGAGPSAATDAGL